MSIRDEVKLLIRENRFEELIHRAMEDKGVIKFILRLLYHPFGKERWQAIEGLGCISDAMAKDDPEAVKELIRRLLWSMNDESGTASWSAPEAIGEIIFRNPIKFEEFVPVVVNASEEDIFHRGIVWALGRISQVNPKLVEEFIPLIINFLESPRPEVRGYAAWSLGQIKSREALPLLANLLNDQADVEFYRDRELVIQTVEQLARQAIETITSNY